MMKHEATFYDEMTSPVGSLLLVGSEQALCGLYMHDQRHRPPLPEGSERHPRLFADAREQLNAYFAGKLRAFELALDGKGSDFQRRVWNALGQIPFGETQSYGEVARAIGNPNASRAVGLANGKNPIGIIVPCHRVIGANGSLTGYGGGIERKRWLLDHERHLLERYG
jgi:methylated-DNA-[protein]-cysteine S-methyltransferase